MAVSAWFLQHNEGKKTLSSRPLSDFLKWLERQHLASFSAYGKRTLFKADFMQQTRHMVKHTEINASNYFVIKILLLYTKKKKKKLKARMK